MKKKIIYGLSTAVLTLVALSGCKKTEVISVTGITAELKVPGTTYTVGDTITKDDFKVTATYSDQTTKEITTWESKDFVTDEYEFEEKDIPSKTFNFQFQQKEATCAVSVKAAVVHVTGVTLDKKTLDLLPNDEAQLIATVAPENATDKTVSWNSEDPTVASVTDGKIKALKEGTTTITVTTTDGSKTDTCTVSVSPTWTKLLDFTIIQGTNVSVQKKDTATFASGTTLNIPSTVDGKYVTSGKAGTTYTVTEIATSGFEHTGSISTVVIPSTVTKIGVSSFSNAGVTSVTFNEGLKEIGYYAFNNCDITTVAFPSTLEKIDGYAFPAGKIASVTIPSSVKYIGNQAFGYPSGNALASATFEDQMGTWKIDGQTLKEDSWTPSSNPSDNASKLMTDFTATFTKNSLPAPVGLGFGLLYGTTDEVYVVCNSVNEEITIPYAVDGEYVEEGVKGKSYKVTHVGAESFGRSGITKINLPNTIKVIEDKAFDGCDDLETINLPTSLEFIGPYAFNGTKLTSFAIPSNVYYIGVSAFPSNLTSLTFLDTSKKWIYDAENVLQENSLEDVTGNIATTYNSKCDSFWAKNLVTINNPKKSNLTLGDTGTVEIENGTISKLISNNEDVLTVKISDKSYVAKNVGDANLNVKTSDGKYGFLAITVAE